MHLIEMNCEKNLFRFNKGDELHLNKKYEKVKNFVHKNPPEYFKTIPIPIPKESTAQYLEHFFIQFIGEEIRKKLSPYDWLYISLIICIYPIGFLIDFQSEEEFINHLKNLHLKGREYLEYNYIKMGLEEIECNIIKQIGFSRVTTEEERQQLRNDFFECSNISIKMLNIPVLEALFNLVPFLFINFFNRQAITNFSKFINFDHPNQKITINPNEIELDKQNLLNKLVDYIKKELKNIQLITKNDFIFFNTINWETKILKLFPEHIDKNLFFCREKEITDIIKFSESQKFSIITGCPGVGITAILKYGVAPALTQIGVNVIYISFNNRFQQDFLENLDQLFPNKKAENLYTQLENLNSENHLMVFIIDDFENIFTIENSQKLKIEMVNFLKEFDKLGFQNRLMISIHDDFIKDIYDFSEEYYQFLTDESFYRLRNFDYRSAQAVITKSIEQINFPLDKKFIETFCDDLIQNEDCIYSPLIHLSLNQLYKSYKEKYIFGTENNPFNFSFYREIGGISALIPDYANSKLKELTLKEQEVINDIFQNMVTHFFTKQRIRLSEIIEIVENRVDTESLINKLVKNRILKRIQTEEQYEYDFVHDSLKRLVRKKAATVKIEETSSLIQDALSYIDANYDKQISLQEVANNVGVTPEYLSRQFKAGFKIGFKEYVIQKRIKEAKQLLLRFPDLPINELSQKTGFMSSQHFINVFKNETNFTPQKFRQKSLLHPDLINKSRIRSN